MSASRLEVLFREVRARLVAGALAGGTPMSSRRQGMRHTVEDPRVLLRAAQEIREGRHGAQVLTSGAHLPLEAAGQSTGIRPNSIRYHDAIAELEYEAAIEWDTSARYARGNKHYVITERGLKMLREPG
jgi:hypothetical protein